MDAFMDSLNMGAAYIIIMLAAVKGGVNIIARGGDWWVFPKSHTEWEVIMGKVWKVSPALLDSKWIEYYRMPYSTYLDLVEELTPTLQKEDTKFRDAIPVSKAVAMVLYKCAKGHSPKDVADKFGVGTTTVHEYFYLMCLSLADDHIFKKYIQVPSGDRLRRIIGEFKQITGIENMAGAIDGSHIKLSKKPPNRYVPADYWSRHDMHSVLLQGVCDANKLFWDVCVRSPGGTHDATHLRNSDLWARLRAHEILREPVISIEGRDVKPYIVGVSAYQLNSFLLKPFINKSTGTAEQNLFDKQIRKGRVKIENAFGILKNRWQILKNLNVGVEKAADVIVACTVLHNICILAGQLGGDDLVDPHPNDFEEGAPGLAVQSEYASKKEGKRRRDLLLADFLERNPLIDIENL
jgi:hypothetical protein